MTAHRDERDTLEAIEEGHDLRVISDYDRHVRSWRTMVVDERGYQVGAAMYDGTRADRDASVGILSRRIAQAAVNVGVARSAAR